MPRALPEPRIFIVQTTSLAAPLPAAVRIAARAGVLVGLTTALLVVITGLGS